ncbi:MAG TPA: hypothetical protein DCX25_03645 [Candidatus Pacebacteria bacterium]|nr:MAG: hypothetical protein UX35_C0012G0008 [Microgenomates group bacterium GW2011_GWA1_46_15]KKU24751.1 MAG: hypothetical protein UX36_C0001G0368 [Microgenomates group bacterium GW2011_GWC1_46_15]HAV15398.1 hypothetical protein [Candidatus Paceibacterota bacterium]HCR11543.1 hypothetical protein [Candidatus Paceibacterota bacterium]HCR92527.1 hypothetical protein [Candidatus Paceibacterota bacterium]
MKVVLKGFILAFILSCIVRLPFFSQIPAGLNRDEAALGYNAFSILKTGRDEYGKLFPISITSFGDQKLPGYVYTLIPFIQTFGVTPFAVRLPSLLAGWLVLFAVGTLSFQVAEGLNLRSSVKKFFPIIAMVLVAISPWGNHFSRTAYEAHLAMAAFLWGFAAYIHALAQPKRLRFFIVTAALWSFTLLTYHSYHILIPLFVLGLAILDRKALSKLPSKMLLISFLIGGTTVLLLFIGGVLGGNINKSEGISPFHLDSLRRQVFVYRQALPKHLSFLHIFIANTPSQAFIAFAQNYVRVIAGDFLFVNGTDHGDHNPGNTPNFHLFTAPFMLLGFLALWEQRKHPLAKRYLLWFFLGIAVPAFTIQPQHTVRLSPIFPLLEIFSAFGIAWMFSTIKKPIIRLMCTVIFIIAGLFFITRYMVSYLAIIPNIAVTHEKDHMLGKALAKYEYYNNGNVKVITQSPSSSPYIWYLFETKYAPQKLWKNIERYPTDAEHFQHVKRIGNIYFETIQWDDLATRTALQPLILIFKPEEMSNDKRMNSNMSFLEAVQDEHQRTAYEVWRYGSLR